MLSVLAVLFFFYGLSAAGYAQREQPAQESGEREGTEKPSNAIEIALAPADAFARRFEKLFIVVGTLILAWFTVLLWDSTHKLWRSSREDAVNTRDHNERQLRAYVHVDKAEIQYADEQAKLIISVKNFGQTPAYDYFGSCGIKVEERASAESLPLGANTARYKAVIGPGGSINETDECGLHALGAVEVGADKGSCLYVWLNLNYTDAFEKTHNLTFRGISTQEFQDATRDVKGWVVAVLPDAPA